MAEIKALELIRQNEKAVFKLLANSDYKMSFFANSIELHLRANPKLLNCTPQSIVSCILLSAQMGVLPGQGNLIHFVPYGTECKPIIGYNGLRDLAERSGKVKDSVSHLVFANDEFEIDYSKEPPFTHKVCTSKERGELIGAYALIYKTNGMTKIEWMPKAEIDAVRNRSKAKDNGPWVTDYNEMAAIRPLRRALKKEKLSLLIDKAIELENRAEEGKSIRDFIDLEPGEFKDIDEPAKLDIKNMSAGEPTGRPRGKAAAKPEAAKTDEREPARQGKPPAGVENEFTLDQPAETRMQKIERLTNYTTGDNPSITTAIILKRVNDNRKEMKIDGTVMSINDMMDVEIEEMLGELE